MLHHTISYVLPRCLGAALLLCLMSLPTQAMPGKDKAQNPGQAQGKAKTDRFAEMDKNGDGKVILEEFLAAFPGMREEAFKSIDTNNDSVIIREEWEAFSQEHSKGMKPSGMTPQQRDSMSNMPGGDPMMPSPGSAGMPLVMPPSGR